MRRSAGRIDKNHLCGCLTEFYRQALTQLTLGQFTHFLNCALIDFDGAIEKAANDGVSFVYPSALLVAHVTRVERSDVVEAHSELSSLATMNDG